MKSYGYHYYITEEMAASLLLDIEGIRFNNIGVNSDYEYKIYLLYMDQPHFLSSRYRGVAVASNSKNPESL